MIVRRLIVLGAALLAWEAGASAARACSCMAPPEPNEARAQAASVFEGRVLAIAEGGEGVFVVTLAVVRTFKGANAERVEVRTRTNSAACGYAFTEGQSYLVYTDARDGAEWTGLCSRTRAMAEAEADIAALGEGITPVNPVAEEWEQVEQTPGEDQAPASGGCASCAAAGAPEDPSGLAVLATTLALLLLARPRARRG